MTIDLNGPLCSCSKRGCFESLAGGWGIAARAKEAIKLLLSTSQDPKNEGSLLLDLAGGDLERVDAQFIVNAYHQNNPLAIHLIEEVKRAMIAGLASLVNLYNPRRLILGGGVIDGIPEIIPILDQGIRLNALKVATEALEVVKADLGADVGVVGAAVACALSNLSH